MIILDMPVATLVTTMVIMVVSDISVVVVRGHVRAPASFGKAFAISLDTARVVGEGGQRLLRQFERTCAGDQWARGREQADRRWLTANGGGGHARLWSPVFCFGALWRQKASLR